eukprot:3441884-Amphidinium_carterae.1
MAWGTLALGIEVQCLVVVGSHWALCGVSVQRRRGGWIEFVRLCEATAADFQHHRRDGCRQMGTPPHKQTIKTRASVLLCAASIAKATPSWSKQFIPPNRQNPESQIKFGLLCIKVESYFGVCIGELCVA